MNLELMKNIDLGKGYHGKMRHVRFKLDFESSYSRSIVSLHL